jgi:hypothetical protein
LRIEQTDAVADPWPLNRRAAVGAVREIRGLVKALRRQRRRCLESALRWRRAATRYRRSLIIRRPHGRPHRHEPIASRTNLLNVYHRAKRIRDRAPDPLFLVTYWNLLPLCIELRPSIHPISHPWHQIAVVTEVNVDLHRELKRPRSRRLANHAASRHRSGLLAFRGSRMHGNYAETLLLPRMRLCQESISALP